ncbi:MAG: hypothetical protein ACRCWB_03455 [Enterovibrio sp.]
MNTIKPTFPTRSTFYTGESRNFDYDQLCTFARAQLDFDYDHDYSVVTDRAMWHLYNDSVNVSFARGAGITYSTLAKMYPIVLAGTPNPAGRPFTLADVISGVPEHILKNYLDGDGLVDETVFMQKYVRGRLIKAIYTIMLHLTLKKVKSSRSESVIEHIIGLVQGIIPLPANIALPNANPKAIAARLEFISGLFLAGLPNTHHMPSIRSADIHSKGVLSWYEGESKVRAAAQYKATTGRNLPDGDKSTVPVFCIRLAGCPFIPAKLMNVLLAERGVTPLFFPARMTGDISKSQTMLTNRSAAASSIHKYGLDVQRNKLFHTLANFTEFQIFSLMVDMDAQGNFKYISEEEYERADDVVEDSYEDIKAQARFKHSQVERKLHIKRIVAHQEQTGRGFFLASFFDHRMRHYMASTYINHQGNKAAKTALGFANVKLLTPEQRAAAADTARFAKLIDKLSTPCTKPPVSPERTKELLDNPPPLLTPDGEQLSYASITGITKADLDTVEKVYREAAKAKAGLSTLFSNQLAEIMGYAQRPDAEDNEEEDSDYSDNNE